MAPSLPWQAKGLPKGSMEFSILASETHLKAHCGPWLRPLAPTRTAHRPPSNVHRARRLLV